MVNPLSCGGTRPLREVVNPFTRSPLGAAQACGSGGDKGIFSLKLLSVDAIANGASYRDKIKLFPLIPTGIPGIYLADGMHLYQ